jgi:putative peptidoglycan lipid II flippase
VTLPDAAAPSATTRALARAGLVVTGAFLISRVLGWLRIVVISQAFPEPADLDPYLAAFRIPDLIYQLVAAGAVGTALIPVLTELLNGGEETRASRVASSVLNLMLVALAGVAVVMWIWAPELVPVLVDGFDPVARETTIHLTRLMLLSPIFLALGAIASAVLNTRGRFAIPALAPIVYNLAIIGCTVVLGGGLGIDAVAIGVVLGSLLHLVIQVPQLRTAMDYTPRIDLVDPAARQTLRLMIPRAIGLGVIQVTILVNTALAARLPEGSVTAYFLAFTILQIPLGVIGFPMGIVLLPSLSRAMSAHRMDDFRMLVERSLRLLLWLTLFIVTTGIALRVPLTDVLFGGVDAQVLAWTAATLAWFLLGLPAHALNVVLTRAFYSDQDTRTPVILACLSVVVNVVVSVATVDTLGLAGLALGVAIGGWFETISLSVLLDRRTEAIPARAITMGALISLGGALIAGAVALGGWALASDAIGGAPGRLLTLIAGGAVGLAALGVYLLYSRIMGIPELPQAVRLLRAAASRRGGEA